MRSFFSAFAIAALLFLTVTCNQTNKNQPSNIISPESFLSVEEVYANGYSMADKSVHVQGFIEHVCKHTWKRFKIVDKEGKNELKIELGSSFSAVDHSILGKKAKVTGKLVPVILDDKMVLQWEQKMKENHKGEENTDHFIEELAHIQSVYKQMLSGDIQYYTIYSIEAESYIIE